MEMLPDPQELIIQIIVLCAVSFRRKRRSYLRQQSGIQICEAEMSVLTDKEIAEIKERCDAASSGPWVSYIEGRDHTSGSDFIMIGEGESRGEDIELSGATKADQDFIAHARQDVPTLLAEIKRLKRILE